MLKVIEAIEEKLKAQEDEISFKSWQIADLKSQLEEAEKEIERLKGAQK